MVVDRCESGTGATTCWHSCTLCRTVRLTSQPERRFPDERLADDASSAHLSSNPPGDEEDSGYAGDPPVQGPDLET